MPNVTGNAQAAPLNDAICAAAHAESRGKNTGSTRLPRKFSEMSSSVSNRFAIAVLPRVAFSSVVISEAPSRKFSPSGDLFTVIFYSTSKYTAVINFF